MQRFLGIALPTIYFLLMGLGAPAGAQWWQDKALTQKLELTQEQLQEINRIFNAYQDQRKEYNAKGQKLQRELNDLLNRRQLDSKAVDRTLKDLSTNRIQMFQEMVNMKLMVRRVLKPEQVSLLLAEDAKIFSTQKRWTGKKRRRAKRGRVNIKKEQNQ